MASELTSGKEVRIASRSRRPPRDSIDSVFAALADLDRPVTRGELRCYGRGIRSLLAAEVDDALRQLVADGLVRTSSRREPIRHGAAAMVRRTYYEVGGGEVGDCS